MSYEYRKMSSEEKKEIVETRKNQGYPLHAPPHPYRDIGWYLITGVNFEHQPILHHPARRDTFQEQLLTTFQELGAKVDGWVILSNHYHLLSGEIELSLISNALKFLHGRTSRAWNLEDNLTGKRRVWYKFTDRAIRNETHYFQALNYIHYNPINMAMSPTRTPGNGQVCTSTLKHKDVSGYVTSGTSTPQKISAMDGTTNP